MRASRCVGVRGARRIEIIGRIGMNKNKEGYPDPTASRAIRNADKIPKEIRDFRRRIKFLCEICGVRVLGKVAIVDQKGRRW